MLRGTPEPPMSEPPADEVHQGGRSRGSAGLPAVAVTMNRGITQMGLTRTARTLLRLNQVDGFDCMGCAWPDPEPGDRKKTEFCENGAKAGTSHILSVAKYHYRQVEQKVAVSWGITRQSDDQAADRKASGDVTPKEPHPNELDGDIPAQVLIPGTVHRSHRTPPDLLKETISAIQKDIR